MEIRIVRLPSGKAPAAIRAGWLGVVLPLSAPEIQKVETVDMLSYPRSRIERFLGHLLPSKEFTMGYAVDAMLAIDILAAHRTEAAEWWLQNAPLTFRHGVQLIFEVEVCEVLRPVPLELRCTANLAILDECISQIDSMLVRLETYCDMALPFDRLLPNNAAVRCSELRTLDLLCLEALRQHLPDSRLTIEGWIIHTINESRVSVRTVISEYDEKLRAILAVRAVILRKTQNLSTSMVQV